jgi:hypothetical protein
MSQERKIDAPRLPRNRSSSFEGKGFGREKAVFVKQDFDDPLMALTPTFDFLFP